MPESMTQWDAPAVSEGWDVIVAGGGPSGCTAAVAAAREGARVLLIEATGCLGGMGTAGLVPAWCPFSDGEKMIYRGLAERVFRESCRGVPHVPATKLDWVAINAEHLKIVYDNLIAEAGVEVLFFTFVTGVKCADDGVVESIVVAGKEGLRALKASVYVDATGDGDLAAWAGAPWQKGHPETGRMQPATFCFILSNINTDVYAKGPTLHAGNRDSAVWKAVESGRFPLIRDGHCCQNVIGPGTVGFNAGHLWDVDSTDTLSLTDSMRRGRQLVQQFRDALAEFWPEAFGDSFVASTAPLMGVRETRRIEGDYVLTAEDFVARRSFPDEIGRNCYFIDIHTAEDELAEVTRDRVPVPERVEHYGAGESHGIPYRCLTPAGLRNLLTAGRCISSDRIVQGSVRVMPVCLVTGEAAGVAAAVTAGESAPDVHAVDTDDLRARLRGYGAWLPDLA